MYRRAQWGQYMIQVKCLDTRAAQEIDLKMRVWRIRVYVPFSKDTHTCLELPL